MLKRFRVVGLCLVAVMALSVVAASSASAAEKGPHWLVPCHKVSAANAGKGRFSNSACTELGGTKEFDTRLLPGENRSFVSKGGVGHFKSSAENIECLSEKDTGQLLGGWPGKDTVTKTFEKCHREGHPECKVHSVGAVNNETIVIKATSELVYVGTKTQAEKEEEPVGDLLTIEQTELIFEGTGCNSLVKKATVKGTVVGIPAKNEPLITQTLVFKEPNTATAWRWNSGGTAVEEIKPKLEFTSSGITVSGQEITEEEITLSPEEAFYVDPK